MEQLFIIPLMIVVMYFFFFRPQMKQQKELKEQQNSLKKGQLVLINNAINGKISQVQESQTFVMVDVGGGQQLRVERTAISIKPKAEKKEN